jgi:phosphoglycerate dehydrogenase-like enzyme
MHIHIENGEGDLYLQADRLRQRLAKLEHGENAYTVSENADPARLGEGLRGADILFAGRKLDLGLARQAAPTLRWVQIISAGVEAWLPSLSDDIVLTNASGVHGEKGGEFVLAAALMLNYAIPRFVTDKAERRWSPRFGGPIAGRTVVLLGTGGIGGAAASALAARGVRVVGVNRSGVAQGSFEACHRVDRLDEILPQADILVSTLPLTAETRGLVDRRRLERLRQGAGVVVVGRADVFDYRALADLLVAEHLGGAVLDVFPREPLPTDDPLWDCPRLVMTPHCSVDDHETYIERCLDIFLDNLERRHEGRPMRNVVDRERGY